VSFAVVLLALAAPACGSGSGGPSSGDIVVLDGQRVVVRSSIDVSGQTAEDVNVEDFSFDPTVLTGSGGQSLTITLHDRGSAEHNFSVPQQQLGQDVGPGQAVTVTVTFPASGVLAFFCRFHRLRGMLGALEAG
jgi:plastocyanin